MSPSPDSSPIDHARAALGEGRDDDYILDPTEHAAELEERAPALAAVLRGSKTETASKEFERLDEVAIGAQKAFRRAADTANVSVLLTACFAAVLLALSAAGLGGQDGSSRWLTAIGLAGAAAGAIAVMNQFKIQQGRLLDRWMSARAAAETQRLRYFEAVTERRPLDEVEAEVALALLQLEYFRRYELDVQVSYYGARGAEHRASADRTLRLGSAAAFVGALALGVSGVWTQSAALGAIGVAGAALASFASTREAITQDGRNAERYGRTREGLAALKGRLDEIRSAVASGNLDALRKFVAAVHEQLSVEHRQWLESTENTSAALTQLNASLHRPESDAEASAH